MPQAFSASDRKLLERLLAAHKKPGDKKYGWISQYCTQVSAAFNRATKGSKKTPKQVRSYLNNVKRRERTAERRAATQKSSSPEKTVSLSPLRSPGSDDIIICKNIRSLGSPSRKSETPSSSGYVGSSTDPPSNEFRSLADDLPKSWEYTEIGGGFLSGPAEHATSPQVFEEREEPHIFDDIDDFSIGRASSQDRDHQKNGMSQDLVNILAEQAKQHHKLKMKLLKEKFGRMTEVYKTKMFMLEAELEMKRKQHEQKMDNLLQEYKKIKESIDD